MAALSASSAAEYTQVQANDLASIFVNCHLLAPDFDESLRKSVDIVVVLDRSVSMIGERLELCKKTLLFLAKHLSAQDRLALVTYETCVNTNLRLTKMTREGKAHLSLIVEQITCGLSTDLCGGLMAGIEEIQQLDRVDCDAPNPVQSVLLLTDGLANEGVTNSSDIVKLVEETLATNVSIHTFGYGSDHDSILLRQISDLGRGSYYFIQSFDKVFIAFADCLGGLLSVVAQNIKVDCIVASPGVTIKEVQTKRPMTTITPGQHYEIDLGNLCSEEVRDILVQIELKPTRVALKQQLVKYFFRYTNVLTSSLETTCTTVLIARPDIVKSKAINTLVAEQKHRIQTAQTIEFAQELANRGHLDRGHSVLTNFLKNLEREFKALNLNKLCGQAKELIDTLKDCIMGMENRRTYEQRGQFRMTSYAQSHRAQRSNDTEATWTCSSTYTNSCKTRIVNHAMAKQ